MTSSRLSEADKAIISPVKGKKTPVTGIVALMTATLPDVNALVKIFEIDKKKRLPLFSSTIYPSLSNKYGITLAGPFIGAPHAAMVLENLICWGVDTLLFYGWCGSISPAVTCGTIVLCDRAFSDEGTFTHYPVKERHFPACPTLP